MAGSVLQASGQCVWQGELPFQQEEVENNLISLQVGRVTWDKGESCEENKPGTSTLPREQILIITCYYC